MPLNRKNLNKLATYLESEALSAEFDMDAFSDKDHFDKSTTCGTVGCAIGHAPYAGIKKDENETWLAYSNRFITQSSAEWNWCFDDDWRFRDNTPKGAAKRIRVLLDKGLPKNWDEQLHGEAKLHY